MTTLKSIETFHIALPTRREHRWTGLTEPIGGYLLVRIEADDGCFGWGEAPALKDWGGDWGRYFGESPVIVRDVIDKYLWPAVVGAQADNIVGLHMRMDAAIKGYPYAKGAVEIAVYDLVGRSRGLPVHALLGGLARVQVPITHSIGLI